MTKDQINNNDQASNLSASINGDVKNSTVIVAGGNVQLHDAKPSIEELTKTIHQLIRDASFLEANDLCVQILQQNHLHPEANLYSGIALLNGNGADKLSRSKLATVESRLSYAAQHPNTKVTAVVTP